MKSVADLHGFGCACGDALPVGEGAVEADDLDARVFTEPAAELFRVASFPEGQWEASGGVDQEGSEGASVESEVVDSQDLRREKWRKRHPHQLGQECNSGKLDVQDPKHPGPAPAGQDHTDVLDQALQ